MNGNISRSSLHSWHSSSIQFGKLENMWMLQCSTHNQMHTYSIHSYIVWWPFALRPDSRLCHGFYVYAVRAVCWAITIQINKFNRTEKKDLHIHNSENEQFSLTASTLFSSSIIFNWAYFSSLSRSRSLSIPTIFDWRRSHCRCARLCPQRWRCHLLSSI